MLLPQFCYFSASDLSGPSLDPNLLCCKMAKGEAGESNIGNGSQGLDVKTPRSQFSK